jgi:hypothetical protein
VKLPRQRIELATSDCDTRYTLKAVHLDVDRKIMCATDGHILAVIPAEIEPKDVTGLIPVRAFKVAREAIKRVKPKLRQTASTAIQAFRKIIIRAPYHGESTVLQRPQGRFPIEWEKAIPKASGAPDVVFNIDLLNRLTESLRNPGQGCDRTVRLWIDKSKRPSQAAILVSVGIDQKQHPGVGVLMPARNERVTAEDVLASVNLNGKATTDAERN